MSMHRRHRGPLPPEHRAKVAAAATAMHARRRGFEIPPDKREIYEKLRRQGIRPPKLWQRLGLAALACAVLMTVPVQAHIWYSGQDPKTLISCCGGEDCGPIDEASVRIVEGGYVYIPTGEFFEHDRAKPSQDGSYHRCQFLTAIPDHPQGSTRCFFAPPMSF